MESLFSLELHVESVEDLQVLCRLPAVSFRLLDFPTLIVHHVDPTMAERLRQKVLVEAGDLSDLKDRSGNFQFQKGKSCLFKANIETLHRELQTTPLYVMLLDLWPKKPKLAASGGIEMKTAIDAIYRQVKKSGVAVPSFYKEFGDYKLFNLMGSAVSRIKLGYRLTSLGGSLIPHVPVGVQIAGKPDKQEQDVARSIADFVSEESGIDRKPAPETVDAARIEGEPEQRDMNTQTEAMVRPAKRPVTVQEERESELIITNTICPPPLYFNALSSPKTRTVIQFCSQEHENCVHGARMEESGEDYADSLHDGTAFEDVKGEDVNLAAVPVQTASVRSRHDKSPKPQQGNGLQNFLTALESSGLSRYPLLNALFQELSCMTTAAKSSEGERQMPVASKTNVSEDQEEYQRPTKTDKPHFGQQPTPKKTGQKALVSKKSSVIGLPKQRVRFKPSSLTYKTTRTQQMRLEKAQKHHTGQDRLCKTVQENRGHVAKTPEATPTRDLGRTYKKHAEFVQMTTQSSDTEAVDGAEEVKAVKILEKGKERVESRIERNREETPPAESTPNTSCQRQNSLEIFLPMADGGTDDSGGEDEPSLPPPASGFGHTGIPDLETMPTGADVLPPATAGVEDFDDTTSWHGRQSESVHSSTRSSISDSMATSRKASRAQGSPQLWPPVSHSPLMAPKSHRPRSADDLVRKVSLSDAYLRGTRSSSDLFTSGEISRQGDKQSRTSSDASVEDGGSENNENYSDDFHSGSEAEQSESQISDSHTD